MFIFRTWGTALPNIVDQISKTKYLNHVIIGLDKVESQAKKAWKFFKKINLPLQFYGTMVQKLKN